MLLLRSTGVIKSNDRVFMHSSATTLWHMLKELAKQKDRLRGGALYLFPVQGPRLRVEKTGIWSGFKINCLLCRIRCGWIAFMKAETTISLRCSWAIFQICSEKAWTHWCGYCSGIAARCAQVLLAGAFGWYYGPAVSSAGSGKPRHAAYPRRWTYPLPNSLPTWCGMMMRPMWTIGAG